MTLLHQACSGYAMGLTWPCATQQERDECARRVKAIESIVLRHGYDHQAHVRDEIQKQTETGQNSEYRKFCIGMHLCLSEHSLYCSCAGSSQDDLPITMAKTSIGGHFVPRMEFMLNRLKVEFSFARLLFYQGSGSRECGWDLYQDELRFTDLHESERIGPRTEMVRLSFRMCFGILDRIARAVCELYELSAASDKVYFESFWKHGKARDGCDRWQAVNHTANPLLVALYSLAYDLSPNGRWPDFKEWRNSLEHGFLVIRCDDTRDLDPLSVTRPTEGDVIVSHELFIERTLLLLRMTRAAIMYFAFLVRQKAFQIKPSSAMRIMLSPKPTVM